MAPEKPTGPHGAGGAMKSRAAVPPGGPMATAVGTEHCKLWEGTGWIRPRHTEPEKPKPVAE
jgi:hypothetical protein